MKLTTKEIKQRYFNKIYANAEIIKCVCGCGNKIKNKDKYGRDVKFINGHNGRKYDDPKQYQKEWRRRNTKILHLKRDKYQRERKAKLIKLLGGECENCHIKYNGENGCIFQFHHKNPKDKEIKLNLAFLWKKWETILKEVKKCKLVCANCHFIIHGSKY